MTRERMREMRGTLLAFARELRDGAGPGLGLRARALHLAAEDLDSAAQFISDTETGDHAAAPYPRSYGKAGAPPATPCPFHPDPKTLGAMCCNRCGAFRAPGGGPLVYFAVEPSS